MKLNFRLSPSAKQRQSPCSGFPPVYQDLSRRHDWLVKKAIVDLPIRLKGNSNAFPVIQGVCWGPRTRISALLDRRYQPGLDYVWDKFMFLGN